MYLVAIGLVLMYFILIYLSSFCIGYWTQRRVEKLVEKMVYEIQRLTTELGREPTEQEIKDRLSASVKNWL